MFELEKCAVRNFPFEKVRRQHSFFFESVLSDMFFRVSAQSALFLFKKCTVRISFLEKLRGKAFSPRTVR